MTAGTLKRTARKAEDSTVAAWGARAGLVARGVLWLVVGVLAVEVALGGHAKADRKGALETLRDQPLGQLLLIVLAAAFAAHACFRLLEGTVGHRDEKDDGRRRLKRAWSLCRVVVYGSLCASTLRFLVGEGGSSEDARKPAQDVMSLPAGRWLVGLAGVGLIVGGIVQGVRGVRQDFTGKLRLPRGGMRKAVEIVGAAGLAGRGLVYALIGWFLADAALSYDPA
jgi:hypothetical protein